MTGIKFAFAENLETGFADMQELMLAARFLHKSQKM